GLPAAPSKPEGERVGSTGILLSWRMPVPLDPTIHSFVIRYKEMCPYPDPTFTEVIKSLDIPETLLNTLTPGATYNIKVAAVNKAGIGPFSQSLYYKTAEAPPGLVSNLTAFAEDHTSVLVAWFLPVRINGLITKFAVKVKHARTGQTVRMLELNAEDIMNGALPHCNSSQLTSAVLPTVTLSAVPSASIWIVPISVKIDELHPYTPYVLEVSAFTSDGEGQIASTMVRMPEAAPEDPPQNVVFRNITSKSLSLTWDPPKIITGRFSYVIQLHSSEEFISENGTIEQAFMYTGLTPYTQYYIHVMAKSAGATGPAAVINITTLAEAPSAVSHLTAEAVDSTSVRLSWRPPSQPNGLITHYRILVLYRNTLVQDITLREQVKHTKLHKHIHNHSILFGSALLIICHFLPATEETADLSSDHIMYVVRRLSPFTKYTFSVTAKNIIGEGPATEVTVKTTEQVPSSVQNVSYQNLTSTSIRVTWEPPLNPNGKITHYTVYAENLLTNHVTQVFNNLDKYSSYKVRVAASTAIGETPLTDEDYIFVMTLEDEPDSPPLDLAVVKTTSSTATLTWSPPEKPNGIIRLYEVSYTNGTYSNTVNSTSPSATLRYMKPYTHYNVTVSAFTLYGHGNQISDTLQMLSGEDVPGSPPYDLTYEDIGSSEVNVSWSPPLLANGIILFYNVEYWNATHSLNQTTHVPYVTLSNLRKYARYRISVQAATQVGMGNHTSEILNITTLEDVPSSSPKFLIARKLNDTEVELSWKPPEEANSEILYYIVRNHNIMKQHCPHSHYSKSFLCFAAPSDPPQNVSYTLLTTTTVRLSWSPPNEPNGVIQYYTIYYIHNYTEYYQVYTVYTHACMFKMYSCDVKLDFQFHYSKHWWVLSDLKAGHEYSVWMSSSTSVGDGGVFSPRLNFTMLEDGQSPHTLRGEAQLCTTFPTDYTPKKITLKLINTPTCTHTQTLICFVLDPDAPPGAISVFPSPTGLKIVWDEPSVISGPTSYIIDITALDGSVYNISLVRYSEEIRAVVVGNLTAFTLYSITITAFTGQLSDARTDGKASEPVLARTLEDEPKDPPKNVTLTVIPEEVTRVYVMFSPPDEPNGNISAYHVVIYRNGQLDFFINSLPVISNPNNTMMAIIDGLKGGFNYSIRIAAVNGAGLGPSSEVQVTTGVKAPPKPSRRPRAALSNAGVIISTSNTITIEMPECFFADDHGPIQKVQVIVSEPAVMDYGNLSNWKSVFLYPTAPYLTDEGFLNPKCLEKAERMSTNTKTYIIGADEGCLSEDAKTLCNGPLKPKTYYVFKFRATNIRGQYTDSEYSDRVRTAGMDTSCDVSLTTGLTLSDPRIHRRQKEGGTYSPREAEIIETKFKLDQLIAVELPKLLQDLATSDADLPWNRSKNRFTNIKPYNNSRVKLLSEPGMPGSDYINASFVSGYLCPNEFIATQGPLPSTVADFWRMIWETGTKTIVMLTQCFEKGRIRCHQYWPEDNKPVTVFADIIITKLTEDVHPDWTVRALRVERHGSYMIVHHFNYTSWPEHGVPESSSTLIQFVKAVRSHRSHDNTTNVVHCSAGVGRTGVFIALDHLIQHVRDHDFVDIYGLVAELRSERMCMVQNLAQYMFLHQSTLDLLSAKGNSQSIWFVNYSALEKMDSLDAMEGDVELEWEETTM
uniref:protein-tyrosine-phosphatase n=1 Tax=Sinocyclocheilus grahami TaxID=75366 RepID=A0A672PIW2_SINGR